LSEKLEHKHSWRKVIVLETLAARVNKTISSGAKAHGRQALNVRAEAPTPGAKHIREAVPGSKKKVGTRPANARYGKEKEFFRKLETGQSAVLRFAELRIAEKTDADLPGPFWRQFHTGLFRFLFGFERFGQNHRLPLVVLKQNPTHRDFHAFFITRRDADFFCDDWVNMSRS
jgi:hypothetical protein